MVGIRVGNGADVLNVLQLAGETEFAPCWSAAEYERIVAPQTGMGPRRCLFVAAEGAAIVGFAVGLVIGPRGEAELESVAVAKNARRRGVGAGLCQAVMSWCAEQGATEMHLEVRSGSVGVMRLYQNLGFLEEGQRRAYYEWPDDDAVLMRCSLEGRSAGM